MLSNHTGYWLKPTKGEFQQNNQWFPRLDMKYKNA